MLFFIIWASPLTAFAVGVTPDYAVKAAPVLRTALFAAILRLPDAGKLTAAIEKNSGFPAEPAVRRRGSLLPSLKMLLEHFDGIAVARYIRPQPTLFASSFA